MFLLQEICTLVRSHCNPSSTLHDLTKKNAQLLWPHFEKEECECLKFYFIKKPILAIPTLSKSFDVPCDAAGNCIGAALNQELSQRLLL